MYVITDIDSGEEIGCSDSYEEAIMMAEEYMGYGCRVAIYDTWTGECVAI